MSVEEYGAGRGVKGVGRSVDGLSGSVESGACVGLPVVDGVEALVDVGVEISASYLRLVQPRWRCIAAEMFMGAPTVGQLFQECVYWLVSASEIGSCRVACDQYGALVVFGPGAVQGVPLTRELMRKCLGMRFSLVSPPGCCYLTSFAVGSRQEAYEVLGREPLVTRVADVLESIGVSGDYTEVHMSVNSDMVHMAVGRGEAGYYALPSEGPQLIARLRSRAFSGCKVGLGRGDQVTSLGFGLERDDGFDLARAPVSMSPVVSVEEARLSCERVVAARGGEFKCEYIAGAVPEVDHGFCDRVVGRRGRETVLYTSAVTCDRMPWAPVSYVLRAGQAVVVSVPAGSDVSLPVRIIGKNIVAMCVSGLGFSVGDVVVRPGDDDVFVRSESDLGLLVHGGTSGYVYAWSLEDDAAALFFRLVMGVRDGAVVRSLAWGTRAEYALFNASSCRMVPGDAAALLLSAGDGDGVLSAICHRLQDGLVCHGDVFVGDFSRAMFRGHCLALGVVTGEFLMLYERFLVSRGACCVVGGSSCYVTASVNDGLAEVIEHGGVCPRCGPGVRGTSFLLQGT